MIFYAKLYYYYNTILFKILRLFIFILLLSLAIFVYLISIYPNLFATIFILYLIFEIYFKYKIEKITPRVLVAENSTDPLKSFSLEALSLISVYSKSENLIKALTKKPQIKFMLDKADIPAKEIMLKNFDLTLLSKGALETTKSVKGKYVTTMDLFAAYLLLTEEENKLLFAKKLKQQDLLSILAWARHTFIKEENPKKEFIFWGEGFAENWVYGWTIEAKKYMLDLTSELVDRNKNAVGRDSEYKQLLESLYKNQSVILIGEAGSGKSAVIENLARESFTGILKENLFHQRVFQLMVDSFMAGAKAQGELEERLDAIIAEVAHSGNIIVYIPEFQDILGSADFNLNLSGALTPYVQKRKIRIIGAVIPAFYKKFIEPMPTFLENFSVIKFDPLEKQAVLAILFQKTPYIERRAKTVITYKAILESYNFAITYAKEKVMPGAAVALLEDAANAVSLSGKKLVEEGDIRDQIKKKVHVDVGEPKQAEKDLLLNLEAQIHKRVISQNEAVSAVSQALRRLRVGLDSRQKPISFLFLGPTGVGKTETAKALAQVYFGDEKKMIRLDMSEFAGAEGQKRLLGSGPGEGDDKGQLTESVYDNPYSLVLLDEFEKAEQKILDLFLQVFDDGRLTDNKGKTVSFANSIVIATSNAASEYIREQVAKGVNIDNNFQKQLLEYLQTKGIFKPELLNRFDAIIIFKPLNQAEIKQIVTLMLSKLLLTLKQKDIEVNFSKTLIEKITTEGFDKDFGARPLQRFIQDKIEDPIAQKMLKGEIKRGDKISVSVDSSANIAVTKIE